MVPYLTGRHQKASPAFLGSAEFRNVLSRCLTRVQARHHKVYVYINEVCTVLKANTQRRKLAISAVPAPCPPLATNQEQNNIEEHETADTEAGRSELAAMEAEVGAGRHGTGSKRQIRYLENLLHIYMGEIRRLQERELDLTEMDSEDSTYLQESRLKRRMMRIFERLCELKQCSSLTGRVIEQRIPYRGTRYPEVNRRIERFINRPDIFPDYSDILKVIQKASARHGLALKKRQIESMAQDAFRDVGNRLQERRHLDLIYNFGSHLTDHYRPGECRVCGAGMAQGASVYCCSRESCASLLLTQGGRQRTPLMSTEPLLYVLWGLLANLVAGTLVPFEQKVGLWMLSLFVPLPRGCRYRSCTDGPNAGPASAGEPDHSPESAGERHLALCPAAG